MAVHTMALGQLKPQVQMLPLLMDLLPQCNFCSLNQFLIALFGTGLLFSVVDGQINHSRT